MWVVKLGGSLAGAGGLDAWLDALAASGRGRAVVVPGGGPFADAVRDAHGRWSLPGETAHRMALLAMAQYGLMIAGVRPEMSPCTSPDAVRAELERGALPVWIPRWDDPDCAREVEASWRVSADSLALWFARRLGAAGVILVKSVSVPGTTRPAAALAAAGVVDEALPDFIARGAPAVFVAGPGQHGAVADALAVGEGCGTRLEADFARAPTAGGRRVPSGGVMREVSDVRQT